MKILIGSAHAGGGHNSLAKIIERILKSQPGIDCETYHVQGRKPRIYYRYVNIKFFNALYRKTDNLIGREIALVLVDKLMAREIKKLVSQKKPDLVITVHYFYGQTLAKLKIPYISFVADPFRFHSAYADTEAKKLIVFSPEAKKRAKKLMVPEEKIILTKFPVNEEFFLKKDIKDLKQKYQVEDENLIITIGGSGDGMEKSSLICSKLRKSKIKFKAFVLCGKNKILYTRLKALYLLDSRFEIIGFTDQLDEYLRISDVFIGKSGPNILFECLSCNTPIIATLPFYAQEDSNREFIQKMNIGWVKNNITDAVNLIMQIAKNKNVLLKKRVNISRIKNEYICDLKEFGKVINNALK